MSLKNIILDYSNPQLWNGQFDVLRVNTLSVDDLAVDALTIGTSILPLTGGLPWIGTTSLPFKNVASINFTGSNLYASNIGCNAITGTSGFIGSLQFLTSGGTSNALNYYEEYVNSSGQASGIWASPQTCLYRITRIGRQCILEIPAVTATANTASVISITTIPTRFLPGVGVISEGISIIDSGVQSLGRFTVASNGAIVISNGSGGNFIGAGTSGVPYGASIAYTV